MAWFRRTRRVDLGKFVAPEPRPPASMADLLEEGELISASAVRLAIKNRIITGSLRDDLSFDQARYVAAVAGELRALAAERDDDAARIRADREGAAKRKGHAEHFHDYHAADASTLELREEFSRLLAERLRALAEDEQFATTIAERAHAAAWEEIGASVTAKLHRAATIADEPDYVIERVDRMRELARDLARLERER